MGIAAKRTFAAPFALTESQLGDPSTAQGTKDEEDGCVCGGGINGFGGI